MAIGVKDNEAAIRDRIGFSINLLRALSPDTVALSPDLARRSAVARNHHLTIEKLPIFAAPRSKA